MKIAKQTTLLSLRIDKWLWAARFYKSRQVAVNALKNGKISLNSQPTKPSSSIKVGDRLTIKQGVYQLTIVVDELVDKRGSAAIAKTMYHETTPSIAARKLLKEQLANQPKVVAGRKKPDKRAVRSNRALKRSQ